MKKTTVFVAFLLLTTMLLGCSNIKKDILGHWYREIVVGDTTVVSELMFQDKTTVVHIGTLYEDGKKPSEDKQAGKSSEIQGSYELEGDMLTLHFEETENESETFKIEIENDILIFYNKEGKEQLRYTRIKK